MRQNLSQSGIFNLRLLLAFTICGFGVRLAMVSLSASPSTNEIKGGACARGLGRLERASGTESLRVLHFHYWNNPPRCGVNFRERV